MTDEAGTEKAETGDDDGKTGSGDVSTSKDDSGIEERIAAIEESFKTEINRVNDAIAALVANGATISETNTNDVVNDNDGGDSDDDTPLEDMDFKV